MVEPLSILGAVSASIGLLNLARQGVERIADDVRKYQHYGKTLAKFKHDVESLQQRLELWEKEWEICNTEQGGEGIRYFGAEGWEEVRRERGLIADLSLSLVGLLSPLMLPVRPSGPTLTVSSTSGAQQPVSKRNKLQKRGRPPRTVEAGRDFMQGQSYQTLRALIEHQQYAKSLDQRYDYLQKVKETLGSRQDQIAGKIQELRERYFQLKSISDSNFQEMHKSLSANMSIQQRREAVQKTWDSKYALSFRRHAIHLIQSLSTPNPEVADPSDVGLELDARRDPRSNTDGVKYTLITEPSMPDGSYALAIRAVGSNLPYKIDPFPAFSDAYNQAKHSAPNKPVWLQVASSTASVLYYSMTASSLGNDCRTIRLAEGLQAQSAPPGFLSYRDRLELAFLLADCCLLLLNTPCIPAFSSENLVIRFGTQEPMRYSLSFKRDNGNESLLVTQLRQSAEPQAYSIGIMLIELALKTKVIGFQEDPPKLTLIGAGVLELGHAIFKTRSRFGPSFAEVVWRCFYETATPAECFDDEQKDFLELVTLHDLHEYIFIP
jgi:chaperonin cofactor prefoldin